MAAVNVGGGNVGSGIGVSMGVAGFETAIAVCVPATKGVKVAVTIASMLTGVCEQADRTITKKSTIGFCRRDISALLSQR